MSETSIKGPAWSTGPKPAASPSSENPASSGVAEFRNIAWTTAVGPRSQDLPQGLSPELRGWSRGRGGDGLPDWVQIVGRRTCFLQSAPHVPRQLDDRAALLEDQAGSDGTPGHIGPETVPKGPLGPQEYTALTRRARYVNAKYDPESLYDRSVNALLPWKPMYDPANRLSGIEREERDALNAAIVATVVPDPTPAEARLDAMRGNPIGTTLAVLGGYDGGEPNLRQTFLFGIGAAVDAAALPHAFLPEVRGPARWYRLPMVRRPVRPPEIPRSALGEPIGGGGGKTVYAYGNGKAIGVLHEDADRNTLFIDAHREVRSLERLRKQGLPTVNAMLVTVDGVPSILMDRFAEGSADWRSKPSKFFNERSISDFENIRSIIREKKIWIEDLQFGVYEDGRVAIADPGEVRVGRVPKDDAEFFEYNLDRIANYIAMARRNIARR
jgi:hypothetical protein